MKRYLNYIDSLEQVRKRIDEIRDKYDIDGDIKNGNDIRYSFLNQLYRLIMSYNLGLVDFVRSAYSENKVKELYKVEDSHETTEILADYFIFLKGGFIYSISTIIENYFRSIYRTLFTDEDDLKEFYKIRKDVFERLNMKKDTDYWKSLSILSNIRNCIHNNGIYMSRQGDINIEYHGQNNIFKNGVAQESARPETILQVVNDVLSLIIEINMKVGYAKDLSHNERHLLKDKSQETIHGIINNEVK